ncbi:hypothetical protein CLOP_g859 [Closterium sp. NIES-67]|nr:hypothetical protein CLOP_g859 [Closterium sp. NIES-67]
MKGGDYDKDSSEDRYPGQFFFVSTQAAAAAGGVDGFEEPATVGKVTLHSLDFWVIDSGATYSMTPRADLLTELEPSPVKHVTSALGQRAEVKGMAKAMFKGADGKMNRALTHVGEDKWVPYVEWIGRKPKVDMLRVLGCIDCKFMENLPYKEWKAENQAKIGVRLGEVKSNGLEHVELPLELSSSNTITRQSPQMNGDEEEEEVQQASCMRPFTQGRMQPLLPGS